MANILLPRDGAPELPLYGMNTLHNAKQLKKNVFALLENMFPGISGKPRNGMNEVMKSTTALGYGTVHSFLRPHALYYATGGKEFFFIWHKNATTTDEFGLEIWNLTDNTRTLLTYGDFNQQQVYISLKPLYNAIYMTMEYEMATSHENAYRTKNKILEWSGSAWTVREMGIDVAPQMPSIYIDDSAVAKMPLYGHSSLVYENVLYLLGGWTETSGMDPDRKVFKSEDGGKTWAECGTNALPIALAYLSAVVFNGVMYVLGGYTTGGYISQKVYSSTDGVTWTEVGTNALPGARWAHSSVVLDGYVYLISGNDGIAETRKVYKSNNLTTWTECGTDALPATYSQHTSVVFGSSIYVIGGLRGGSATRKVISSLDGATWSECGTDALPATLRSHASVVFGSRIWNIGGYSAETANSRKVYYTTDGATWVEAGTDALPYTIKDHCAAVFDGKMIVFSGTGMNGYVYESSNGASWGRTINGITKDKYVSIAFTFVKKSSNSGADTTVFEEPLIESIEDIAQRQIVFMNCTTGTGYLKIPMPAVADAAAQGATHLRVWRTLEADSSTIAAGLAHRFLCDLCISGAGYATTNIYTSTTSNSELSGELHLLDMTGYEVPPMGRYFDFDTRAWIGGNPSTPGSWFFSESPINVQFPQKFASMFKTASGYWIACDPTDGQYDTGTVLLKGDRYFFKERKIFALAGADPANVVTLINPNIGCAFPQTLTRMFIPQLGGECVGFLSESGPAVLLPGGQVQLLNEFAVAELWPTKTGLIKKSNGLPTSWYTRNTVTAGFWGNTWWIFSGDSRDTANELTTNKIFGFHFGNDGQSLGPFQVTIPQYSSNTIFEPLVLVPVDNNRAYAFSHKATGAGAITYRLAKFLDPSKFQDTYITEGAISYDMIGETGYRNVGPRANSQALLERAIVYINFADTDGLVVTVTSDNGRLVSTCTYSQERQSGVAADNTVRDFVSIDALSNDAHFGSKFKIRVAKTVPSTGDVEFFGAELELNQNENEAEFSDNFAAPTGATTFVAQADAVPEVNAYA